MAEIKELQFIEGTAVTPGTPTTAEVATPDGSNSSEVVTVGYLDNEGINNKGNATGSDPLVSDDNTQGYSVGSQWFNTSSGVLWIASDVTTGAAVWVEQVNINNDGLADNILTTRGDIIITNNLNAPVRLPIGSAGQVVQSDGVDVSWETPVAVPPPSSPNFNYVRNGDFHLNQPGYGASSNTQYTLNGSTINMFDGWEGFSAGSYVAAVTQVSATNFTRGISTADIQEACRVEITTADASLGATDVLALTTKLPGFDYVYLSRETQFTVSFTFYTDAAGTYTACLRNGALDTYYLHEFTAVALTENRVSFSVDRPTIGTFGFGDSASLLLHVVLDAGASRQSATLDTWINAATIVASTNQVNFAGTIGNFFELTGVKIEPGSTVTNFTNYGNSQHTDTEACLVYYDKTYDYDVAPGTFIGFSAIEIFGDSVNNTANRSVVTTHHWTTKMRTTPSVTVYRSDAVDTSGVIQGGSGLFTPTLSITDGFVRIFYTDTGVSSAIRLGCHATANAFL